MERFLAQRLLEKVKPLYKIKSSKSTNENSHNLSDSQIETGLYNMLNEYIPFAVSSREGSERKLQSPFINIEAREKVIKQLVLTILQSNPKKIIK